LGFTTGKAASDSCRRSNVLQNPDDPFVDGGVLGLQHCLIPEEFNMISLRVTNYTVYTLTLFGLCTLQSARNS